VPLMVDTDTNADKVDMIEAWSSPKKAWVPGGEAVAALMAAMIGMLTLAAVNQGTDIWPAINACVHGVGKLWMPGAEGIGPYSGKETLSLVAWVGSWIGLHYGFRRKEMSISRALIVFLVGVGIATTWIWPPVFNGVAKLVAGH
jgi:hypothetical protein